MRHYHTLLVLYGVVTREDGVTNIKHESINNYTTPERGMEPVDTHLRL